MFISYNGAMEYKSSASYVIYKALCGLYLTYTYRCIIWKQAS